MKKLLIFVLALTIGLTSAHSYFGVGLRAGALFGFHSLEDDSNFVDIGKPSVESKNNFNLAVFGAYYFTDRFSLQGELNFMIKQAIEASFSTSGGTKLTQTGTYSVLDIPVLLKYAFIYQPITIGLLAGPYLSIPIGEFEYVYEYDWGGSLNDTDEDSYETDGTAFGLTVGLFGGVPMGPGNIVVDIRFLFDLTPQKAKFIDWDGKTTSEDIIKRRGVALTLGYELLF